MSSFKELGFDGGLTCALECADLDKSLAWYQEVLGFALLFKADELAWAELKSPVTGVTVGVAQVEAPSVVGGATLTWGVADIAAARIRLEKDEVRFDGETQTIPGMVSLATFFDPDGNRHMLYQDLSGEGQSC